jgi:putative polymerase
MISHISARMPASTALTSAASDRSGLTPVVLVVAAALFNAGLAVINARFRPISGNMVALCEVLIVASAHFYVLRHFQARMINWYFLALGFAIFAILRISVTDNVDAKYFRDMFLIVTFVLLGMTSNERRVIQAMLILQVAVIGGILFEAVCVECYGDFFAVKDFYINTRGLGEEEFTTLSSDLYVSATRPEARFLPFFELHRLSSVFLEPVSLGNFMVATLCFTAAFWRQLSNALRALFIASLVLMLFASDGRLAALASIAIIFASIGHRLIPRHAALLFLPGVIALAMAAVHLADLKPGVDDLAGRIAYTVDLLSSLSAADVAGLSDRLLDQSVDAGFIYLILTQSVLGLAALWAVITLSADEHSVEQKIYKNGLLLYLALTMMVSYSYLSIKTAAPIWFIFGALLSSAATPAGRSRGRGG